MTPPVGAHALLARQHSSHALFVLPTGAETDGPCLIEPTVMCNHCGYCETCSCIQQGTITKAIKLLILPSHLSIHFCWP